MMFLLTSIDVVALKNLDDSNNSLSDKEKRFVILTDVWVIYPNGGEILHDYTMIFWDYEIFYGVYYTYFKIYCVGHTITYTLSEYFTLTQGLWNTTQIPNGEYKIKVELWGTNDYQNEYPTYLLASDYSDDWFTIDNNNKPNIPYKPVGPSNGISGAEYTFSTKTTDPDGDLVKYGWDWNGDGIVDEWTNLQESGTINNCSHIWYDPGTYIISVKSMDEFGKESDFSTDIELYIYENNPPLKPAKPTGEESGKTDKTYTYTSTTNDPDGDQIWFLWDFGDETNSSWDGPYNTGENCEIEHSWDEVGEYTIKVKAKDVYGEESEWSDPLVVTMPKTKTFNQIPKILVWLFERFPSLQSYFSHLL